MVQHRNITPKAYKTTNSVTMHTVSAPIKHISNYEKKKLCSVRKVLLNTTEIGNNWLKNPNQNGMGYLLPSIFWESKF